MDPSPPAPIHVLTHEFLPQKGGIATFAEEMARAAAANGSRVEVWAPKGADPADRDFPFDVFRLGLRGSQDLACQLRLARACFARRRELRSSIVYLCDPGPILAMRFLSLFRSCRPARLVLTFHGSEVLRFAANPLNRALVGRVTRLADRVSAPSRYVATLVREAFPGCADRLVLTPGALPHHFAAVPPREPSERASGSLRLLTVGRLHPRKGQLRLLEALHALPQRLQRNLAWDVVGSGEKHGYAQSLRDAANGGPIQVVFHGDAHPERLRELYGRADLFALTSMPFRKSVEGFGLVYLEAAAHGLPVVAHDIGGVSEAIDAGRTGLLADPQDPATLAAALARLLEDPELRQRLGAAGPAWARRHSWSENAKRLFADWNKRSGA